MQITITAGKGGTGKTTVATNLAISLKDSYPVQLIDCDVEEPDAHIFVDSEYDVQEPVYMKRPVIDQEKCTNCGKCADLCNYNALAVVPDEVMVFPELCHGCGLCSLACPVDAITERDHKIGVLDIGRAEGYEFLQGTLEVGDPIAPPVIEKLKTHIKENKIAILDSPPGTACPAVEAIWGSDFAVLVTEPTPFGLHDLKLTVEICEKMEIPYGVVINRDGIGDEGVDDYCEEEGIPILLRIPDSRKVAEAYSKGIPFVSEFPDRKSHFLDLFEKIQDIVKEGEKERI